MFDYCQWDRIARTLKEVFKAEMYNREYFINLGDDQEFMNAFFNTCEYGEGKTAEEYLELAGYGPAVIEAFMAAKGEYLEASEEYVPDKYRKYVPKYKEYRKASDRMVRKELERIRGF